MNRGPGSRDDVGERRHDRDRVVLGFGTLMLGSGAVVHTSVATIVVPARRLALT